jgi:GNAT superfamily N-acetyltransferase
MSEFRVRSIQQEELFKLLDLYKHLFEKADAPLPPNEQLAQIWDGIMDNPLLHYFVGQADGQIVSSCTMAIIPNLTRGARPYGLIENVVTHRDYRKRGYGTQVLQHALQVAWNQDCYKVMLMTGRKDEATLRFYQRAGFKRGIKTGFIAYPEE